MADAYIVKKGKVIATYKDYAGITALPLVGGAEQLGLIVGDSVSIVKVVNPTTHVVTLTMTGVFTDTTDEVMEP